MPNMADTACTNRSCARIRRSPGSRPTRSTRALGVCGNRRLDSNWAKLNSAAGCPTIGDHLREGRAAGLPLTRKAPYKPDVGDPQSWFDERNVETESRFNH